MKKIYFLLLIYSNLVFSASFEELEGLYSERHPELLGNELIGQPVDCNSNGFYFPTGYGAHFDKNGVGWSEFGWACRAVGWQKIVRREVDVAGEQYSPYYTWLVGWEGLDILAKCPTDEVLLSSHEQGIPAVGGGCCHTICVSDFLGYGDNPYTDDSCGPIRKAQTVTSYHLLFCTVNPNQLSNSETTAKTKNKLTAEENSKLGSIANSEATQSGLLAKILDAFKNLVLPKSKPTSTDPLPTPTDPPPEPEAVPLSDDKIRLNEIPPLMSSGGACPAAQSFSVFGRNYSISNEPFCSLARRVRSLVIASARVTAAWIILGAL